MIQAQFGQGGIQFNILENNRAGVNPIGYK